MQLFVQSGQIGFLMGAIQISFEFGMPWKERMGCVYVGQRKTTRLVKKKVAYNIRGVYTVQEH